MVFLVGVVFLFVFLRVRPRHASVDVTSLSCARRARASVP